MPYQYTSPLRLPGGRKFSNHKYLGYKFRPLLGGCDVLLLWKYPNNSYPLHSWLSLFPLYCYHLNSLVDLN